MKITIRKPLYTAGLLMALGAPTMVGAAVEFEQGLIPEDFVQHLVLGGNFYSSLPDGFPVPAVLPAGMGFWVVGSHVRGGNQRVVLQTNGSVQQAVQGLKQAYMADGWIDLSTDGAIPVLCHDALGGLMLRESYPGGNSRIDVSLVPPPTGQPGQLNCIQQHALLEASGGADSALAHAQSQMPVLIMPETAVRLTGPGLLMGFRSGGGQFELEYSVSITMPDADATLLYGHFAQMLLEQGWNVDSSDAGARSSSSIWFKPVDVPTGEPSGILEPPFPLSAVMLIFDNGADRYQLKFTLQTFSGFRGGVSSTQIGSSLSVRDFIPSH